MDNLDYIESFFNGPKDEPSKQQFEKRIIEDSQFADDVAFYIAANGAIKTQVEEEKKQRFRKLYEAQKLTPVKSSTTPVRKLWRMVAAACIVAVVAATSLLLLNNNAEPTQLASTYINNNFQTLDVTMGETDSLQKGLDLYNKGNMPASLQQFESILISNPSSSEAKKYAGIVSLQLSNYDKALKYFDLLAADTLEVNAGIFYKAVTLMKRNAPADKDAAITLLDQVVANDMEGRAIAEKWLKQLK